MKALGIVVTIVVKCLCLPVVLAVGGQFGPADSAFPAGVTGADSDGMPLSLSTETMLEGFGGVFRFRGL